MDSEVKPEDHSSPSMIDVVSCGIGGLILLLFVSLAISGTSSGDAASFLALTVRIDKPPKQGETIRVNGAWEVTFPNNLVSIDNAVGRREFSVSSAFEVILLDDGLERLSLINVPTGIGRRMEVLYVSRKTMPEMVLTWNPEQGAQLTVEAVSNESETPLRPALATIGANEISIRATVDSGAFIEAVR